jgi:hypothetical protein
MKNSPIPIDATEYEISNLKFITIKYDELHHISKSDYKVICLSVR